jgi:hypothetical protein
MNKEITQLENKINQVQLLIDNQKQKLASHENTLLNLTKQLTQIKNQTTKKDMKKITKNNVHGDEKINSK